MGSPHGWKGQSSNSSPRPVSLCVLINLEACLFLRDRLGLARALELGGGAQDGLHSQHDQHMLDSRAVGVLVLEGYQR